jgi:hypothetical protein
MPPGRDEPDPSLVEEVVRWRTQAMTRWSNAVASSFVAEELRIELANLRESYENLLKERDILIEQVENLSEYVGDMRASTSWRITRPLRFVSGLLSRSRGG